MPKWKKHDTQFRTEDDVFIAFKHSQDDKAVVAAHNADIDALTAERDELQRRLDADDGHQRALDEMHLRYNAEAERDELQRRLAEVVVKISEAVVSDDDCVCSMLCYSAVIAIAEGRDNG